MKKLILGVAALLFATNFVQAQSGNERAPGNGDLVYADRGVPEEVSSTASRFQDDQHDSEDPSRTKTFTKSFLLNGSDKISLSNKYGDILIKTWDKNEVKVDVEIKAYSKNENDAQRLLDETTIESGKSGDGVSFKTVIRSDDSRYGSGTKNGKTVWRREVKVNYVVYLPSSNALTVYNQYGNVSMGNFTGAFYSKIQYGNFTAGKLSSSNNYLSVQYGKATIQEVNKLIMKQQYGSGLTLGTVGTLDLDAQYAAVTISTIKGDAVIKQQYGSGLNIGSVNNLDLDAQYSNVSVANINGNASIKQQYNNISIGSVNKLSLNGQYATVKVASLKGDGDFKVSYNKLTIDNISTGCKILNIKAGYAGVTLGFGSGYHADFDVKTNYGSFKYNAAVSAKANNDGESSRSYNGKIGNGGVGRVTVKSDYGAVIFN